MLLEFQWLFQVLGSPTCCGGAQTQEVSSGIPARTSCIHTAAIPAFFLLSCRIWLCPWMMFGRTSSRSSPALQEWVVSVLGAHQGQYLLPIPNRKLRAAPARRERGMWEQGDAGMVLQDFSTLQVGCPEQGGAAGTGELQGAAPTWGNGIWLFQGREVADAGRSGSSSPQPNFSACFNWIL